MNSPKNTQRGYDLAEISWKGWLALTLVVLVNYAISGMFLASLPLGSTQCVAALVFGAATGYALSGRVLGTLLRRVFGWQQVRCVFWGTYVAHVIGGTLANGVGLLIAYPRI